VDHSDGSFPTGGPKRRSGCGRRKIGGFAKTPMGNEASL
jgi:hypothetical protein